MNEKILFYIWLSSSIFAGSKTPKILLEHFGDIEKIFHAEKKDYEELGITYPDLAALCNKNLDDAKRYYEYCKTNRVGILCYEDPFYPERLKIIENPPPMFYYKGTIKHLDDFPCLTMVGTRSCSERGFRLAYESGFEAASKGAVIVNGLAKGIDGACVAGALDANGYAIGLLGCGIDRVYPYENKDLFERLTATGLILTEFPPFSQPDKKHFPARNRVMSALSLATVIFEADEGSGALITAKHALSQGRRIFAVPGKPYDKSYAGPLELIKDGASIFTEADDVLSEYSMSFPHRINLANDNKAPKDKLDKYVARFFQKGIDPDTPVNRRYSKPFEKIDKKVHEKASADVKEKIVGNAKTGAVDLTAQSEKHNTNENTLRQESYDLSLLSSEERAIYDILLTNGSMTPDEISEHGIKIEDILAAITLLEIYGIVTALPGGKYETVK